MENKDFGNQIQDIVQNSLNSMDFKDLNKKIENTVNTTIAEVRKSLKLENGAASEKKPDRGTVADADASKAAATALPRPIRFSRQAASPFCIPSQSLPFRHF